jgi:protein required for attachment to host cells
MKKIVIWIVIADGTQAHVYEHTGPGSGLVIVKGFDLSIDPLQSREIGSDRPGRTFASHGTHRSAKAPSTDPAQHRETEFIRSLAGMLDSKAKAGAFDKMVIAAAPIALGDLRKALSDHVKKRVIAELDKDLTNIPTQQLGNHLEGIIAM